jgi:hypothetical protein
MSTRTRLRKQKKIAKKLADNNAAKTIASNDN